MSGWSIFAALINFAILAVGLYLFGKKIVIKKYKDRREKIARGLEDSQAAAEKAAGLEDRLAEAREQGEAQRASILAEAQAAAGKSSLKAQREKETALAGAQAEVRRETEVLRAHLRQELNRQTAGRLAKAAGELLAGEEYAQARKALTTDCVKQLAASFGLPPGELARVEAAGEADLVLTAAEEPDIEDLVCLAQGVGAALRAQGLDIRDGDVHIRTRINQSVLAGVRLRVGDTVYDGTLSHMLERAEASIAGADAAGEDFIGILQETVAQADRSIDYFQAGKVTRVSDGICRVSGLPDAVAGEMLEFGNGLAGMVMDLEPDNVGVVLLGEYEGVQEGNLVRRTGRVMDVPVGEALLGRVVDAMGRPVDGGGFIAAADRRPIECPAPGVVDRQPVSVPMQTGIKAIDALVPIGRGQRELIIGDRQTGKTAIAVDAIINQKGKNMLCVYAAIGQKESTVAGVVEKLRETGALEYTIVVCASASEPAPMLYIAPYTAASMAEYFMYKGRDVLVVYDDLSKQAVAYREISLLLHRPPGREAYPGDVFYLHSRLLERAARLSEAAGGGSMTALPIIETQAGDISAYIPTNVISITDGQIFLETGLFNAGVRPAVNVGLSVSRVGGAAQPAAVKQVAGRLRMEMAQYRELAAFTQFGMELDKATQASIDRGDRLTELLKQPQYRPMDAADQMTALFAVSEGYADRVEVKDIARYESGLLLAVNHAWPELRQRVAAGGKLNAEELERLRSLIGAFSESFT